MLATISMFSQTRSLRISKKTINSKRKGELFIQKTHELFMQIIIEYSLKGHFRDMYFHRFLAGRVVFLYGTSTAGKSSIVSVLKAYAQSQGRDWKMTGTDHIWRLHIFNLFEQYSYEKSSFVQSYFTIEEIFDCLWNPLIASELIVEKSIPKKEGEKIISILLEFRSIQNHLLKGLHPTKRAFFCARSLLPALSLGQTVIIDTAADVGDIDEFYQVLATSLVHCKIDLVVVYCSLKKLIERLYSRNEAALASLSLNHGRPGAFPIEQYSIMYKKTNIPSHAIDSIEFSDTQIPTHLPEICKKLDVLISKQIDMISNNYNEIEWMQAQTLIQRSFDLNSNNDTVYIKPKCDYQYMVNTGEESAEVCAEAVLRTLRL